MLTASFPHTPLAPSPAPGSGRTEFVSHLSPLAQPLYTALAEHLSLNGTPGELSRHPQALTRLLSGEAPIGAVCGLLYLRHRHQLDLLAAPVASTGPTRGKATYAAQIVVRRRHPATRLTDLRGAHWAVNETDSFSGYVALLARLRRSGEDETFIGQPSVTGSHIESLHWVRSGRAEAASIDSTVLQLAAQAHPRLMADVRVVASLGPYPAPPIVVHRSVSLADRAHLKAQVLNLHRHPNGQATLARGLVSRFVAVTERDYDPILLASRWAEGG